MGRGRDIKEATESPKEAAYNVLVEHLSGPEMTVQQMQDPEFKYVFDADDGCAVVCLMMNERTDSAEEALKILEERREEGSEMHPEKHLVGSSEIPGFV